MIEKDLAHLRFLHNISAKGGYLDSTDIDFVIQKKAEIEAIKNGIDEILKIQQVKNKEL